MKTSSTSPSPISVGEAAMLACLYEATAPKPGNVHPGASFADSTFEHFQASARVIGPIMQVAQSQGVGQTVLDAVCATRDTVGTNTNLGMILLFAPLAVVADGQYLSQGIPQVLDDLTSEDTRLVYEAIRISSAGGLGRTAEADIANDPPPDLKLVDAMRLAADRDLIARQYTNAFADVFSGTAKFIPEGQAAGLSISESIVWAHIHQLAAEPDSLIQRKCGQQIAREASDRAAAVLASSAPGTAAYRHAVDDFDRWLRADGHRRNPGTTADLIAAGLFVLLREGRLQLTDTEW
jgi:triphosphoribosyl-dephospho-CoA synthase